MRSKIKKKIRIYKVLRANKYKIKYEREGKADAKGK